MPVRVDEDGTVRATEWHGHFLLQELDRQIERAEEKEALAKFPSRDRTRELENLKHNRVLMEALRRAWMRSVVEGHESPLHMVLLQMDELSHAGLGFDCLNPEDFQSVHRKFPEFVPGPRGVSNGEQAEAELSLRLEQDPGPDIDRAHVRGQ